MTAKAARARKPKPAATPTPRPIGRPRGAASTDPRLTIRVTDPLLEFLSAESTRIQAMSGGDLLEPGALARRLLLGVAKLPGGYLPDAKP